MKRFKDVFLGWENEASDWSVSGDATSITSVHDSESPMSKTVLSVASGTSYNPITFEVSFDELIFSNVFYRISDYHTLAIDYKIDPDDYRYIDEIFVDALLPSSSSKRGIKTISGSDNAFAVDHEPTVNGYATILIPMSKFRETNSLTAATGLRFYFMKNSNNQLSNINVTSFRLLKQDSITETQIDNQKLNDISFDGLSIEGWVVDNISTIEKNIINHNTYDTLSVENLSATQGKIYQTYITTGDRYIQNNTKKFMLNIKAEKRNKISLGVLTDDGLFQGTKNYSIDKWEMLSCDFTGTKIITIFIYVENYSGMVTITNPILSREINGMIDNKISLLNNGDFKKVHSISYFGTAYNQLIKYGEYTGTNRSFTKAYPMWITSRENPLATSVGSYPDHFYILFDISKDISEFKRFAMDFYISNISKIASMEFFIADALDGDATGFVNSIEFVRNVVGGENRVSFSIHECEKIASSTGSAYKASMNFNIFAIKVTMASSSTYLAKGDLQIYDIYPTSEMPYTVIADMQDIGPWSLTSGVGSVSTSTDNFVYGTKSVALVNNDIVGNEVKYEMELDYNIKSTEILNIWLKTETGIFNTVRVSFKSKRSSNIIAYATITGVTSEWACHQIPVYRHSSRPYYNNLTPSSFVVVSGVLDIDEIGSMVISTYANGTYLDNTLYVGMMTNESMREITSFYTNKTSNNIGYDNGYYNDYAYSINKTITSSDHVEYLTDIGTTKLNLLPYRNIYLPFKCPAAYIDRISKVYMVIMNASQTVKLAIEADISGLEGDTYKLLKFAMKDLEVIYDAGSGYFLNLNEVACYGIRIVTNNITDIFYDVTFQDFVTDNNDLRISGTSIAYDDSIISEKYIGFMINIPDEDTLSNIESLNLTMNNYEDFRYSKLYKVSGRSLIVGWNKVFWDREDYYLNTYNPSLGDMTNKVNDIKISVLKYDYEINDAIEVKEINLFDDPNFGVVRLSKIDVIGTEQGKHWEGRLLKVGSITRKMSEKSGLLELPSSNIEIADTDEKVAGVFSNVYGASNFLNNEVNIKIGTTEDKESEFLNIYKGYINDINFKQKKASLKMSDTLAQYMVDLPRVLLDGDLWTGIDESDIGKQASTIYGRVDSDVGALPLIKAACIPAIDEEVNEFHTQYYVVAGHPCKDGTVAVFFDGVEIAYNDSRYAYTVDYDYVIGDDHFCVIAVPWVQQINLNEDSDPETTDGENDIWVNPWEEDVTNEDALGEETVISTAPEVIAVNAHGKTVDGNSASALLEDVVNVIEDVLVNEMGIPSDRINTDNFSAIQTIILQQGQLMAGAIVENMNSEEVLAGMLLSHNISMYIDKDGLICLYSFKPQKYDTTATLYTDEVDILENSFTCETGVSNLVNRIRYRCNFNYSEYYSDDEKSWEARGTRQSDDSISRVGKAIDWDEEFLNLPWIRDLEKADNIASKLLQRFQNGRPGATLTLPLSAYVEDLSNRIRITHFDGVSLNRDAATGVGWDSHLCVIKSVKHDPDKMSVTLIVDNIQDLALDCSYLGDNTTFTTLWANADANERTYLYLADATTGKMSDGTTDGHKLC